MSTTARALGEAFAQMPRSRIALETGLHSPWVSRQLSELRTRGDRGACAQAAADRVESKERRSAGRADAGAVGADRSGVVVSGEASQSEGAGGPDGDPGASGAGASTDSACRRK